jgi:hypothetical protein
VLTVLAWILAGAAAEVTAGWLMACVALAVTLTREAAPPPGVRLFRTFEIPVLLLIRLAGDPQWRRLRAILSRRVHAAGRAPARLPGFPRRGYRRPRMVPRPGLRHLRGGPAPAGVPVTAPRDRDQRLAAAALYTAVTARRRRLLGLLERARRRMPSTPWPDLVRVACQDGENMSPPARAAEFDDLAGRTIGELYGREQRVEVAGELL